MQLKQPPFVPGTFSYPWRFMMKKQVVLMVVLAFLTVNTLLLADIVSINDGMSHTINDYTYLLDTVWLDHPMDIPNFPGTHVDLAAGGVVTNLTACNNATISVTGGTVMGYLVGVGNSQVSMISGDVGWGISAYRNASVTISGGMVTFDMRPDLRTNYNGTIYLDGSDFEVTDLNGNTIILSNGDKLSDFVSLVEWRPQGDIWDYYTGTIIGTLADGSTLHSEFEISNTGFYEGIADIVIIPEPGTVFLLGVGCLVFRRRRR
jgi:hypothetical protein